MKIKNLINIVTFLTITACTDNEQKTVYKNDRFELLPEPGKDLRENMSNKRTV